MMPVDSDPKIPHGEGHTAWVEVGSALLSLALEALTVSAPQSLSNNVGWEWESANACSCELRQHEAPVSSQHIFRVVCMVRIVHGSPRG